MVWRECSRGRGGGEGADNPGQADTEQNSRAINTPTAWHTCGKHGMLLQKRTEGDSNAFLLLDGSTINVLQSAECGGRY